MRLANKLVLLLLVIPPISCLALEEDSKAPMYIVSDKSTYNYKNGTKTFEGHVKVDQGTTHLTADKLITKNNNENKMKEAIAYGLQENAHYWTVPKLGDKEVNALAKIIKVYPIDSNVVLENDVVITQGDNSFKGELIIYNRNDQTITVPESKQGRAVLVYNPDN